MGDRTRVIITNNQKEIKIPTGIRMLVRRTCNAVLKMENFSNPAEISVTFVNDEEILKLNKHYREKNRATDVLSFPMGDNGIFDINPSSGARILGDIVISLERAAEQADRFGHSLEREVSYLTAHSMLHLLGYDHEDGGMDKVRMREKEETVMGQLGLKITTNYTFSD
ncbi:MAG: rRNA maturation RNase YbeY [Clostridia bacterium]